MTSILPVVAGVTITVDAKGRYNLNALHKASGEGRAKDPAHWLRNKQAQDFVSEVEKQTTQICIVSMPGRNGGTFAHELVAVEYAGWISPRFRIKVNQTFIDYRTGQLTPADSTPSGDPVIQALIVSLQKIDALQAKVAKLNHATKVIRDATVSVAKKLEQVEARVTPPKPTYYLMTLEELGDCIMNESVQH
jgi:hypothetical protein